MKLPKLIRVDAKIIHITKISFHISLTGWQLEQHPMVHFTFYWEFNLLALIKQYLSWSNQTSPIGNDNPSFLSGWTPIALHPTKISLNLAEFIQYILEVPNDLF